MQKRTTPIVTKGLLLWRLVPFRLCG
jgi:hypothetical protein